MFEELIKRLKAWNKINNDLQEIIKTTGSYGMDAIIKMRNEMPETYSKYLDLCSDYHRADESVWAERDRLQMIGIEYNKQPSRSEVA